MTMTVNNSSKIFAGACLLAGLASGFLVGAKWMERKLSDEIDSRVERETAETRAFYESVHKNKYPTPGDAVKELVGPVAMEALKSYKGEGTTVMYNKITKPVEDEKEPVETAPIVRNVFDPSPSPRNPNTPYIITTEEFRQNDPEYVQSTLTYYEPDMVLADDHEDIIENKEDTVGLKALSSFGLDPDEPDAVYVRNEKIQMDFEVVRSEESFAKVVLGIDDGVETRSDRKRD